MTRIKICGMKDKPHALAAAEAGADFIGMVFAPCPRQVNVSQAYEICRTVKKDFPAMRVVGVFVDTPSDIINQVADACLDWVQLSGNESWEDCLKVKKPLIKAVRPGKDRKKLITILSTGDSVLGERRHVYLLDSEVKGKYGGTGTTFDWRQAKAVTADFPIMLAGGLNPENVGDAIRVTAPWGVDVSSGVETNGVKDIAKIQAFIQSVRRADAASR